MTAARERTVKQSDSKADWIDDKCPRCQGTGADPDQSVLSVSVDPTLYLSFASRREAGEVEDASQPESPEGQ
jgi:hypothetical protein